MGNEGSVSDSQNLPVLVSKRILLVISGGIAAYKALELIRLLRQSGASVRAILTRGGAEFVTALSVGSLAESKVYTDLWSLTDEAEMGHIRLSREADLIVVAPASANLIAKLAHGIADDLASTVLLATDKPILVAPAMNVRMWENPATVHNMGMLVARNIHQVGPEPGAMACGEFGMGRMAEPTQILHSIAELLRATPGRLSGRRALVTSGPTREPIDPVRYMSNRSSGKQGHAIASALARLGAATTLVTGPTNEPPPPGVQVVAIETASEMLAACENVLPVDIAVCAAAVSDWRPVEASAHKIKKHGTSGPPEIRLTENPDILAAISRPGNRRPKLVIGFALETDDLMKSASEKLKAKGCDWIVANAVTQEEGVFGGDFNNVALVTDGGINVWPRLSKVEVGDRLAAAAANYLAGKPFADIGIEAGQ